MKKHLFKSVARSAVYLSMPIVALTELAFLIWTSNDIELAKEANITDIFSNAFNIVALYATIFFVLKLTSEAATSEKGTDVEKALVTDRLKSLHMRLDALHEVIEGGELNFTDTTITFDRIYRSHNSILNVIADTNDNVGVDRQLITSYNQAFEAEIENCRDVLTYTPPRSDSSSTEPVDVSISENTIYVSPNGVHKAGRHLTNMKTSIDRLIILINRA